MGAFIGWFLIAAIVGVVIWAWNNRRSEPEGELLFAEPASVPHMEGEGWYEFDIVGEGSYQDALNAITGGKTDAGHELECVATLNREPNNPHDPNAIAVMIGGRTVQCIARREAKAIPK